MDVPTCKYITQMVNLQYKPIFHVYHYMYTMYNVQCTMYNVLIIQSHCPYRSKASEWPIHGLGASFIDVMITKSKTFYQIWSHCACLLAGQMTTVKVAADWASDWAWDWASHSTVFNHSKVDYLNPFFWLLLRYFLL